MANTLDLDEIRGWINDIHWTHKIGVGANYFTSDVSDQIPDCIRAFAIKLPPDGMIPPHVDMQRSVSTIYCLESNPECLMVFGDEEIRLKPGESRTVDRKLTHWSKNDGNTDRIHLVVERG